MRLINGQVTANMLGKSEPEFTGDGAMGRGLKLAGIGFILAAGLFGWL